MERSRINKEAREIIINPLLVIIVLMSILSYQSAESSSYLGFILSEVLREYAMVLKQEGDKNKAEEINSLADWWDQANLNAAEQAMEKNKEKKIEDSEKLTPDKSIIKTQVPYIHPFISRWDRNNDRKVEID